MAVPVRERNPLKGGCDFKKAILPGVAPVLCKSPVYRWSKSDLTICWACINNTNQTVNDSQFSDW